MVEETKFKVWHIVQTVIGAVLVLAISGVAGSLLALNESVIRHDLLLEQLVTFRNAGDRYTKTDGDREKEDRIAGDSRLAEEIAEIFIILSSDESREHEAIVLLRRDVDDIDHSVKKIWSVINDHLKKESTHAEDR